MAKPEVDTAWALQLVAIPVLDKNNNPTIVLSKKEPTVQYKNLGVQPGVPILGGQLNYKLYADHAMIEWLRGCEVGTILEFLDGTMTLTQLQQDRGGTWVNLGTETRTYSSGTVTVRAFRKSA
jgi:hypothetical protein